jgi:glyoxylase-like metal-dependent hydrolase (beta-lactamase superfamily II)
MRDDSLKKRDGGAREIAPGVYCMETGKGISRSNVYFVRSGGSWTLIDAASVGCGKAIINTAGGLFGDGVCPAAIIITHDHPDHAGAALELARSWHCFVYVHPDELDMAVNASMATFEKYANPMDRWVILPIMRLMPKKRFDAMIASSSLKGVCYAFEPRDGVPGLQDWEYIHVPGHTPGEIAFFRKSDRVLITGDAVVTAELNSLTGMLSWAMKREKQKISSPPRYSTWNWKMAKQSVAVLTALEPRVLATGHGVPVIGEAAANGLRALAKRIS